MSKGFTIRFQHWVMLMTVLLVSLLSAAFLVTAFRTFTSISEQSAATRFALIAGQASSQLESLLRQNAKFTAAQASAQHTSFITNGRINTADMVPVFIASLKDDPSVYSHFFGLKNEEFLQVIGIRNNAQIISTLKAPENSYFAVRRITRNPAGTRTDRYEFLDVRERLLGSRESPASFVPSERPWFSGALEPRGLVVTKPYLFASTGEPGITVAAPLDGDVGVLATDISLSLLQHFLTGLALPPNGAILVQDAYGQVLAFDGRGASFANYAITPVTPIDKVEHPLLTFLKQAALPYPSPILHLGAGKGEPFVVTRLQTAPIGGAPYKVAVLAPLSDFTAAFDRARIDVLGLALLVLMILLPLAFVGSRQIARALVSMAHDSEFFKKLDFDHTPHKPSTYLYEVNALGEAQSVMYEAIQKRTSDLVAAQGKLENLIKTGIELGRERDRMVLLRKMLFAGKDLLHCDAGTLYLVTEHKTLSFAVRTKSDELPSFEIPLYDEQGAPIERFMATWCALHNEALVIDDVYRETRFDVSGAKSMDAATGYRTVSMLSVPISPRAGEVLGVMQFLNAIDAETGGVVPFSRELVRFVSAMAAQAAVALDNLQLLEAQENLMEALIKLIAGSIDAKSPYTGGHCERVPELAIMLAKAACEVTEGPLAEFSFTTDDQWREFRIGAWLHDCGKVTTPEYVVDKASKLETIYNRIHEIRMRFEVLLRDARISALENIVSGADGAQQLAQYEARKAQLADDFAFVAECNVGGEFMAQDKIERLQRIAAQTWLRHYDDRLGLPHEELKRYTDAPVPLPATEALLADKPHHIIPRSDTRSVDPKWGFKVNVPQNLYNHGEVYNLSISRGTLTEEERFKINEHVMQSLIMLEQLPLPKSMRRVPEYAGTHHETLIGTGYPRRLDANALSMPSRIMALADIFEALTASDRPYKKTKTLSESVKILAFFKKDQHIDADLFDLFLSSGVYQRYAEKYLLPEQIDDVDVTKFIG